VRSGHHGLTGSSIQQDSQPEAQDGVVPEDDVPTGDVASEVGATLGADREKLAALLPLLGLERFDRRGLNRALADLAAGPEATPS